MVLTGCETVQQPTTPQAAPKRSSTYTELTDHEKFLSGLFFEEYDQKLLWTTLRFWQTDTTYPWAVAYRGLPESVWVIAYPEATFNLIDEGPLADPTGYGEKLIKGRYVIPVPRAYRETLFGLKKGATIKVYGKVRGFSSKEYLLTADKIEIVSP